MTFYALLTKELRLRFRRERTLWVIVAYLFALGLLGWFALSSSSGSITYHSREGLSQIGRNLYSLLSIVQLFLIIFITPSFTATMINGEKERQTFEMLLCSRLSAFALVSSKLLSGLASTFLLIVASIPLFSLVFFFGGISPEQILLALLIYSMTALVLCSLGICCSTLVKRPTVSTAMAYIVGLLWLFAPLISSPLLINMLNGLFIIYPNRPQLLLIWNPLIALSSTYPGAQLSLPSTTNGPFLDYGLVLGSPPYHIGTHRIAPWMAYSLLNILATVVLLLLSMVLVRPTTLTGPLARLKRLMLPKPVTVEKTNLSNLEERQAN